MRLGHLPDGSRGFDANQRITPAQARDAVHKGYKFAVRYVRRAKQNDHDLIAGEMATLLTAGLAVSVVQHVALEGWIPAGALGASYGAIAGNEAMTTGVPRGVTIWCDLEGVRHGVPASETISFCNAWHAKVTEAGYHPGLYVGDSCGLTATQLYKNLRFNCYWSAYNLNRDEHPAVRGVCMRQKVATLEDLIDGLTNETMDVDVLIADRLGGSPVLLLP
jgi:hypothetical protein